VLRADLLRSGGGRTGLRNMEKRPILFVCVHNAGRSQMAEAFLNRLATERGLNVRSESAGTVGGAELNPVAVQVMEEIGIPMEGQRPKLLTQEMADSASRIITMGCGVDADACPARIHVTEDWGLGDPKGREIGEVRRIRDETRARVEALLDEMAGEP
jgi:arsenate reductase (thioredoxin)